MEAIHRDYEPKDVRFYYVYKLLAHPEKNGFIQPFTIAERLLHIQEAKRRLGVKIPWLCDTMANDLVHALGNAPTSEFIIDPEGKVARKRAWGKPQALRKDLEELVGPVDQPTKAADLDFKFDLDTAHAASGVVERITVPRGLRPIVVEPVFDDLRTPFYVKLRADADAGLLIDGTGKLYLGFHIDPLYHFHWNNLTKPIHVDIQPVGKQTVVPNSVDGLKVDVEADVDPREFLIDVSSWNETEPLRLTVRYFACNDKEELCLAITQKYVVHREFDHDSGWPELRNKPLPPRKDSAPAGDRGEPQFSADDGINIFSGEPRLLIANGYSTSKHWWAFLQRKIDRHRGGSENRVVEVRLCNKGGSPIARWIDVDTGERSTIWKQRLTPMIRAEKGKRPVVVLCQQSLQGVYRKEDRADGARTQADRASGIRSADDHERIKRGADVIQQYAKNMLEDGAAAVVIGMHIYKRSMEPAIGNERLALTELMTRKPARIFAGPDVWKPTSKQHPLAFDTDKRHPNFIGAEIMAHYWFKTLLEREGLDVPEWSREEMEDAINNQPMGLTRNNDVFEQKLMEWKIVSREPLASPRERRTRKTSDRNNE